MKAFIPNEICSIGQARDLHVRAIAVHLIDVTDDMEVTEAEAQIAEATEVDWSLQIDEKMMPVSTFSDALKVSSKSGKSAKITFADGDYHIVDPITAKRFVDRFHAKEINNAAKSKMSFYMMMSDLSTGDDTTDYKRERYGHQDEKHL